MNDKYKVGDLIYDANIYDGMNTSLADLPFYKRWLPENKDALILELCCGTGRLTLPIAKEGYDIVGVDNIEQLEENVRCAARFVPMNPTQMSELEERTLPVVRQALYFRRWNLGA